ncbi:hypothetical protein Clacol_005054 [Clathrus columnatus]|uniref:F-box domain-containing protein n=1 Tax=Clathrus columnatus TaxID=1419009 RepID=A0AAV5ACT8_9AGAM|nr:hypothetical protein Clacol_005054 [Clathrus columnatus]
MSLNEFDEKRDELSKNLNSGQLRLSCVDIGLAHIPQTGVNSGWFEYLSTDPCYLRELIIEKLPLPWAIPPHQKLTRLIIKNIPAPAALLTFLSHCPLLNELEIDLVRNTQLDTSTTAVLIATFQTLDFPHLKKLKLSATDPRSYECILEVSSRIVISRHLLSLCVTWKRNSSRHNNIDLGKSLSFIGPAREPFDHSPVIDLIRGMPDIRHLQLVSFAWELLISWNIDFTALFPHLTSLELYDESDQLDRFSRPPRPYRDCTAWLTALIAFPNVNLHTLILREVAINSSILLDAALKIGMKYLRLEETHVEPEILAVLCGKGIEVISPILIMHSSFSETISFHKKQIHVYPSDVSSQTTTTSLYVPTLSDTQLVNGSFLLGSLLGAQDGTSTYKLIMGTTNAEAPSPSLTLIEASTTAHLFGSAAVDDEGDNLIINVQCTINGDLSTCKADAGGAIEAPGVTAPISTITFTETVTPVPVTLVGTLPSTTPNSTQPTSSSSSGSSTKTALSSQVTPGLTSSTGTPNVTTSTSGSVSTTTSNSASYYKVFVLLWTLPIVAVAILVVMDN